MNWYDAVLEIKHAQENNQLVIFVGAGVSANSKIPTWGELIKKIAVRIDYSRCDYCKCKKESCPEEECGFRSQYSQEEYLRIPEYFYQSVGAEEYYRFIKAALDFNNSSNAIDDEIFRIYPHHVITTNYDSLLENSNEPNAQKYSIVFEDKGLLSNPSDKYILKMHGDLEHMETIVLRETDYTVYEQQHPMISTFIKALLVNHTFVFIGYSLNDNNLNLIIGWINYFKKYYHINGGPQSFFVTTNPTSEHETERLRSEGINVINLNQMPKEVINESSIPEEITNDSARRLLVFLKSITEIHLLSRYTSLNPVIKESLNILDSYNKISILDLLTSVAVGPHEVYGNELVLYDKSSFDYIKQQYEKNPLFLTALQKAGLSEISRFNSEEDKIVVPPFVPAFSEKESLFLDNKYGQLVEQLDENTPVAETIFYYHVIGCYRENLHRLIQKESERVGTKDFIPFLLQRIRAWLIFSYSFDARSETGKEIAREFNTAKPKYANATKFLHMLFNSTDEYQQKMEKSLEKHEERYEHNPYSWTSGHAHIHLWKIQAYAYDYYYFILKNHIPIHYSSNAKVFFEPYIRAMLCTYSPATFLPHDSSMLLSTHREPYVLNRIDLDIITKFSDSKSLRKWIEKYSVRELRIEPGCNAVELFINLSGSLVSFQNAHWGEQLTCLAIIIGLVHTARVDNTRLIIAAASTIRALGEISRRCLWNYFPAVNHIVSVCKCYGDDFAQRELLSVLLDTKTAELIIDRFQYQYQRIIKNLSVFCTKEICALALQNISNTAERRQKANMAYTYRTIIPECEEKELTNDLIDSFDSDQLITLVLEKRLSYDDVEPRLFRILENNVAYREKKPGVRTFPDRVKGTIEGFILLYLVGEKVNLSQLARFRNYSEFLAFVLDPEHYDFAKVDLEDYMWQNLLYSKQFEHYFIEHKKELLTDELERRIAQNTVSEGVRKVVYGMLLDREELRTYGDD